LQASFDFPKLPAEQMSFDFYRNRAERCPNKKANTKERKSKSNKIKPEAKELRQEKSISEDLVSQKEISFKLQIQQTEIREREFRAAHATAINGLRQIAQKEGAIFNPQEFAKEQSAILRQTIQEKHGLSIYDMGYSRENWASIVLSQVSKAVSRESTEHLNFAVTKAEREISSMRREIEEGSERVLTALAGKNSNSHSSSTFDHEHSGNQKEKDWSSVR
jgi:hypothetical protein